MGSSKTGIFLILIGLLLFAFQLEGVYRSSAYLVLGITGLVLWWKLHRLQGVLVLSLVGIALALRQLFSIDRGLEMLLLCFAFLIPWLIQGRKEGQVWTLIVSIVFAVNSMFSWQNPWFVIRIDAAWTPLAIGLAFAVVYFLTRRLGFLIPGAILTGIGIMTIIPSDHFENWMIFLGLALAFAAIWAIHTRREGENTGERIWPLFPTAFFTVFTVAIAVSEGFSQDLFVPIFLGTPAAILLIIYGFKRHMGILIPGLMLGSVSLWFFTGTSHVIPLLFFFAGSFLLILVLETRRLKSPGERWWPLIPAVILAGNGVALLTDLELDRFYDYLGSVSSGLILIGVGILLILSRNKNKTEGPGE